MTDQELADRIVGHGVGYKFRPSPGSYCVHANCDWDTALIASEFVRDGRVVLAMMEKVGNLEIFGSEDYVVSVPMPGSHHIIESQNESLAVAINTACCEALDEN